jgi:hypothetical protein
MIIVNGVVISDDNDGENMIINTNGGNYNESSGNYVEGSTRSKPAPTPAPTPSETGGNRVINTNGGNYNRIKGDYIQIQGDGGKR